MLKLAAIILLFTAGTAQSQIQGLALTEITNLYEIANNPETKMPLTNQGKLSTCWAYVASHLTEYNSRSRGIPHAVNPLWTAVVGKKDRVIHWTPESVNYNYMPWAFSDLRKHGVCDQNFFKQKLQALKGNNNISDDELLLYMSKLSKKVRSEKVVSALSLTKSCNWLLDPGALSQIYEKAVAEIESTAPFNAILTESLASKFRDMVTSRTSMTDYIFETVMKGCPLVPVQIPKIASYPTLFRSVNALNADVNQSLSGPNPKPTGVGYFDAVWKHPPGTRIATLKNFKQLKALHYSVIVGKAKMYGENMYLIRNSRGPNYLPQYRLSYVEIMTGPLAGKRINASPAELVGLNYQVLGTWISESDLWHNSFALNIIKD